MRMYVLTTASISAAGSVRALSSYVALYASSHFFPIIKRPNQASPHAHHPNYVNKYKQYFMTMCISTKRSLKRSATEKKTADAITFSKPPCILATHHMNCVPRSNDLSILVNRVLQQYQQQSSRPEQVVASKSLKSPKKCVRFDASVKMPETSSPQAASTQNNATLKTSQLLLQVRIVLKILEKEDPHLRHRLVQSIDRLRKTRPKGRTFNRSIDTLMRGMVDPETYQTATEARIRLASAV